MRREHDTGNYHAGTTHGICSDCGSISCCTADYRRQHRRRHGKARHAGSHHASSSYTVYLITMDLTDSYWKSIDDGCLSAVNEIGNITYK